jgi:hypothetical protein
MPGLTRFVRTRVPTGPDAAPDGLLQTPLPDSRNRRTP